MRFQPKHCLFHQMDSGGFLLPSPSPLPDLLKIHSTSAFFLPFHLAMSLSLHLLSRAPLFFRGSILAARGAQPAQGGVCVSPAEGRTERVCKWPSMEGALAGRSACLSSSSAPAWPPAQRLCTAPAQCLVFALSCLGCFANTDWSTGNGDFCPSLVYTSVFLADVS